MRNSAHAATWLLELVDPQIQPTIGRTERPSLHEFEIEGLIAVNLKETPVRRESEQWNPKTEFM
jgi:hypothetical protein